MVRHSHCQPSASPTGMVNALSSPVSSSGDSGRRTMPKTNPPASEYAPHSAMTAPVQPTSPASRSAATSATSVPPSTTVVAAAAASTATSRGRSHPRRGTGSAGAAASSLARIGGLRAYRAAPASTMPAPTRSIANRAERVAMTRTASAGPAI